MKPVTVKHRVNLVYQNHLSTVLPYLLSHKIFISAHSNNFYFWHPVLLIELISISNMGVSLIETCFCSRLYGISFDLGTLIIPWKCPKFQTRLRLKNVTIKIIQNLTPCRNDKIRTQKSLVQSVPWSSKMEQTWIFIMDVVQYKDFRNVFSTIYTVFRKASILSGFGFNKFLASQHFFRENATD